MNKLLKQWGTKFKDAQITSIRGGIWQVDLDEERFILKRRRNRTKVFDEYELMVSLLQSGLPISQLLYSTNDVPWGELEGSIYVLYPFLEGNSGTELTTLNTSLASNIGTSLAKLHKTLANYETVEKFPTFDVFNEVASFAWAAVHGYIEKPYRRKLQELEQTIGGEFVNIYETLERQLVHRDFHLGNIVVKDNKLVGILDFDRVRVGIRVFDLSYFTVAVLTHTFSKSLKRDDWFSFTLSFLDGYLGEQSLDKAEGYSYFYVIYLILILFAAYNLDADNLELADLNICMLFWLHDQHDYLQPLIEKTIVK